MGKVLEVVVRFGEDIDDGLCRRLRCLGIGVNGRGIVGAYDSCENRCGHKIWDGFP